MLIRFESKIGAFSMFGDIAVTLLKLMGHSGTVPGAILADDIPDALARLRAGLHAQPEEPETDEISHDERDEKPEPRVSIHKRAVPLVDLLTRSAQAGSDVMWR
ncbi:MAG: DUF1840 domain-containing protein [Burkholderiales bacterium]|nr:DUF1840 domain-containing protein [Burkholderiales bacterium]